MALVLAACSLAFAAPREARSQSPSISPELAERLDPRQMRAYLDHLRKKAAFDRLHDAYWSAVDEKREGRRRKRASSTPFDATDYIAEPAPAYSGPPLPPDVARIIATLRKDPPPRSTLPGVADFLANAKLHYNFVPRRINEATFKRRYAQEALRVGLSRAHVLEVYALETGGQGTYDMQAGINPITKAGSPISSALGYAQLLHANSVNELVKHGAQFSQRLTALARAPGTSRERAAELRAKIAVLARMRTAVRRLPNVWSEHIRFGASPKGLGIHALNLDPDIGPWLQVIKLKGLLEEARKAGRTRLTGPQIELMNLAGPRTGLEMMEPVGSRMPTTNFFSRAAYYRNTIVRGRTGAGLLEAIAERMRVNIKQPGAVEFARIFDQIARETRQR